MVEGLCRSCRDLSSSFLAFGDDIVSTCSDSNADPIFLSLHALPYQVIEMLLGCLRHSYSRSLGHFLALFYVLKCVFNTHTQHRRRWWCCQWGSARDSTGARDVSYSTGASSYTGFTGATNERKGKRRGAKRREVRLWDNQKIKQLSNLLFEATPLRQ